MEISGKQREILEFMIRYQEEKGYPPAVREIGTAVGLSSTSTVHGHLSRLEAKGYIRRDPSKPRAIEIVKIPEPAQTQPKRPAPGAFKPSERVVAFQNPRYGQELVAVPILGRVRAGEPILAVENIMDYFPLPVDATHNSECFMLRVQGESMINAGILDGDDVLVAAQSDARNGDMVVALIDDSATVKTFYREDGYIRLQPENDSMDPIIVENDLQILGKVIGVMRFFH